MKKRMFGIPDGYIILALLVYFGWGCSKNGSIEKAVHDMMRDTEMLLRTLMVRILKL